MASRRATGCTTETTRIASHRSLAKSPTGSTGFLATALQRLTDLLAGLGLEPKAAKTRIVHLEEEGGGGFDFLGFHHRMVRSRGPHGKKPVAFLARWPSDKAMQHARDRIRDLTARSRLRLWPELIAEDLNRVLRGWGAYFRFGNWPAGPHWLVGARATSWRVTGI
jgi:hypothetical protein